MTTTKPQSTTEPTSCDYRNKDCAATGVTIGGKWICNNHICEQRQQCWLNTNTRISPASAAPVVDEEVTPAMVIEALRMMVQLWDDNHPDDLCACVGASDDCKYPPPCELCCAREALRQHGSPATSAERPRKVFDAGFAAATAAPQRAKCANCAESIVRDGDEWVHEFAYRPECATAAPQEQKISAAAYEQMLTTKWDETNARRHALIELKRLRTLFDDEAKDLAELQWLAGIKRELNTGPCPVTDSSTSARVAAEEIAKYLEAFTPLSVGGALVRTFESIIERHRR